jgi:hypothetical protein
MTEAEKTAAWKLKWFGRKEDVDEEPPTEPPQNKHNQHEDAKN